MYASSDFIYGENLMDLYFYYVDKSYIEFLKKTEISKRGFTCVPNVVYTNSLKFTFGAVFRIGQIDYFAPVSSYSKPQQDLFLLKDKKNVVFGSLRFNYMIPVSHSCLKKLDINKLSTEFDRVRASKELACCRRNREKIFKKSESTYKRVVEKVDPQLVNNSCDFKLLEDAYIMYCHDNGLTLNETQKKRYQEITNLQSETFNKQTESLCEPTLKGKFTFSKKQLNENAKKISEAAKEDSKQINIQHPKKDSKDKTI